MSVVGFYHDLTCKSYILKTCNCRPALVIASKVKDPVAAEPTVAVDNTDAEEISAGSEEDSVDP